MTWDKKELEIVGGNITIEPLKGKDVWSIFNKAKEVLDKLGVGYWVAVGTLLGLYRDGDFMPHDSDIDFECCTPHVHHLVVKEMTQAGFPLCRVMNYAGKPMQRAFLDRDTNIIVDIYFYHDGINYNDHGILELPENYLDPETYLAWRYGEDWITPKTEKADWGDDTKCLKKEDTDADS